MNLAEIAALLGLTLGLSLATLTAAWAVAWRTGKAGLLDGLWPLVMLLAAGATFLTVDGDPVRKTLLLWLTAVWAAREACRRLSPRRRREADARYARAFEDGVGWRASVAGPLLICFLPQGALAWLTALPVQLGQVSFEPEVGGLGWSGAVLAVVGLAVAGLGGLRSTAFPKEAVADEGLMARTWRRWRRRPDYVGDLAVWWGLFLIAAETGPGRWSVIGPVFLTLALAHWAATEPQRKAPAAGATGADRSKGFTRAS